MKSSVVRIAASSAVCQDERFALADDREGETVSPALRMLREAIDELHWKHDAVAAAINVSAKYFSRMLSGEKPWTLRHIFALPDDVEARFIRKYAESFGLLVVERVDDATAREQLASGLFNLLAPRLPAKADRMAKADVALRPAKVDTR